MNRLARRLGSAWLALLLAWTGTAKAGSTLVVTNTSDSGEGSLRAAVESANLLGGDSLVDLRSVSGMILLSSPLPEVRAHVRFLGPEEGDLQINGQGQWPILSFAAGTTGEVHRLILTNAFATGHRHGAALSNAGTLLLRACRFVGNLNRHGRGGAVHNLGHLSLLDCSFQSNTAQGEPGVADPARAGGGALFHEAGTLLASNCLFLSNTSTGAAALPASGGLGGLGAGGAFVGLGGSMMFQRCRFEGNAVRGGPGGSSDRLGGPGGDGLGGAGFLTGGEVRIEQCEFAGNRAQGQPPGGYTDFVFGGSVGAAGIAEGGALCVRGGVVRLVASLFTNNVAVGGQGGSGRTGSQGGVGLGGGVAARAERMEVISSLFVSNRVEGGEGGSGSRSTGNGGDAVGGAIAVMDGSVLIENSTLSGNQSRGGHSSSVPSASAGSPGASAGGGLGVHALAGQPAVDVRFTTVSGNRADQAAVLHFFGTFPVYSGAVSGGGLDHRGGRVRLAGTILAGNHSLTNADVSGTFESLQANLVQTPGDASGFQPHDLVGTDPGLGPLSIHGGAWATHALLAGSPAIDVIPQADGPAADQRGYPRPSGAGWDLGAYERETGTEAGPSIRIAAWEAPAGRVKLSVLGQPGSRYRLEASADMTTWTGLALLPAGGEFLEPLGAVQRFYRLVVPPE